VGREPTMRNNMYPVMMEVLSMQKNAIPQPTLPGAPTAIGFW